MSVGARDCQPGTITSMTRGPSQTLVVIEVEPQVEITSIINTESSDALGLKEEQSAYAVITSSSMRIRID